MTKCQAWGGGGQAKFFMLNIIIYQIICSYFNYKPITVFTGANSLEIIQSSRQVSFYPNC
jgi:hypothetical protein